MFELRVAPLLMRFPPTRRSQELDNFVAGHGESIHTTTHAKGNRLAAKPSAQSEFWTAFDSVRPARYAPVARHALLYFAHAESREKILDEVAAKRSCLLARAAPRGALCGRRTAAPTSARKHARC